MPNQTIRLIGGRRGLPWISPLGLSMNKRTTVWRRYHQSHICFLALHHVDHEPRLSTAVNLRNQSAGFEKYCLLYMYNFMFCIFVCVSVCVWVVVFFTGTQNWQPRASPAMSCECWKVGCGGHWREGRGKGSRWAMALTASKCDMVSDDIMNS